MTAATWGHGPENVLVWCDLETTGLDPEQDSILEIAIVVTDWQLDEVFGYESIVQLPPYDFIRLSRRVFDMHASSGLLQDVARATDKEALPLVDETIAGLLSTMGYCGGAIAGSTPSFDRAFIRRHMPLLDKCFDHRCFDVSTLKQAYRMWEGPMAKDEPGHRAMADLRGSIAGCRRLKAWMRPSLRPAERDGLQADREATIARILEEGKMVW